MFLRTFHITCSIWLLKFWSSVMALILFIFWHRWALDLPLIRFPILLAPIPVSSNANPVILSLLLYNINRVTTYFFFNPNKWVFAQGKIPCELLSDDYGGYYFQLHRPRTATLSVCVISDYLNSIVCYTRWDKVQIDLLSRSRQREIWYRVSLLGCSGSPFTLCVKPLHSTRSGVLDKLWLSPSCPRIVLPLVFLNNFFCWTFSIAFVSPRVFWLVPSGSCVKLETILIKYVPDCTS